MKIAVLNQKGGVGKTTISVNLSYGLAKAGKKTLIIDLDPQAHSTLIFCRSLPKQATIKELFVNRQLDLKKVIKPAILNKETIEGLDIIGSNIHLAVTAEQIISKVHREKLLHHHLQKLEPLYDFIIIDCPPALNVLTVNAIYSADLILIPTLYSSYSLEGIADLFDSIATVKETKNYKFCILRNSLDTRNKRSNDFIEKNLKPYKDFLLKTAIRKSEPINQAQMNKEPVFSFDPNSHASEDFTSLTKEIIAYA
ncbi:MAG: ParA family protein [Blastocatellia bacterium]